MRASRDESGVDEARQGSGSGWLAPYGLPERYWMGLWSLMAVVGLVFYDRFSAPQVVVGSSVTMLLLAALLPQLTYRMGYYAYNLGRLALTAIGGFITYDRAHYFIEAFRGRSYEMELMQLDELLFGVQPSQWLQAIHHPVLTEYLQLAYSSFYPVMLVVALALLFKKGAHRDWFAFLVAMNVAFIMLHVTYFLIPARSPFLIADMEPYRSVIGYDFPLQGLLWTDALRQSLLDATPMRFDCVPSGHTMHTVIPMIFSWRINKKFGAFITFIAVSIVFSTLYLRYHYAFDLVLALAYVGVIVPLARNLTAQFLPDDPVPTRELLPARLGQRRMVE